jgi:hypothetical protein
MDANPENFKLTLDEVKRVVDGADGEVYAVLFCAFTEDGVRRIVGHTGREHMPKQAFATFQAVGNALRLVFEALFDPIKALFSRNPVADLVVGFAARAECSYDGCPGCPDCCPDYDDDDDDDDDDGPLDLFRNGMVF